MREILFRGKRIDNSEWVEGFLLKECNYATCSWNLAIEYNTDRFGKFAYDVAEVIPETVGQFTGLTDKNGKKIFEGDIVEATIVRDMGGGEDLRKETGIIGYDEIGMIGLITEYYDGVPVWTDIFQELTLSGCINDFWFEVIGNIHDNPELLEVE